MKKEERLIIIFEVVVYKKLRVLFNSSKNFKIGSVRIPFYGIKSEFDNFADVEVFENDFDNFHKYDVLIAPADSQYIEYARENNPEIFICLTKPHYERFVLPPFSSFSLRGLYYQARLFYPESWSPSIKLRKSNILLSDLVIADSPYLKQHYGSQDVEAVYIKLLEKLTETSVTVSEGNKLVFGYHGNYKHFNESMTYILPILESLADKFDVTLKVMTNINEINLIKSDDVEIDYREYSYPEIFEYLSDIDIGLVPNNIHTRGRLIDFVIRSFGCFLWKTDRKHDLTVRYKQSVNAGRAYIFAQLNKPFIGCAVPDVCTDFGSILGDYLVMDKDGWRFAIDSLANDKAERTRISNELSQLKDTTLSLEKESLKLKDILKEKFNKREF